MRGKVVAVTFIYNECPDICPLLTQKMVQVQDELAADFGAKVAFVSISLDPAHDTPDVFKDYAQFWGARLDGWSFLTGSVEAVRDVTRPLWSIIREKVGRLGRSHPADDARRCRGTDAGTVSRCAL